MLAQHLRLTSARPPVPMGTITMIKPPGVQGTLTGDTWTPGHAYHCARSLAEKSSGKWYVEVEIDSRLSMPGIVRATHDMRQFPPRFDDGVSIRANRVWYHGAQSSEVRTGPADIPDASGRRMYAVDLDAGLSWAGLNGTWYGGAPGSGQSLRDVFPAEGPLTTGVPYVVVLSPVDPRRSDTIIQPARAAYPVPPGFAYWVDDP